MSDAPRSSANGAVTPLQDTATVAGTVAEEAPSSIILELDARTFTMVWWIALMFHAGCAAFSASCATLYYFITDLRLLYYNKLLHSDLGPKLRTAGFAFLLPALLHFLEFVWMVGVSWHARELSFHYHSRHLHKVYQLNVPMSARQGDTATGSGEAPAEARKPNQRSRRLHFRRIQLIRNKRLQRVLARWHRVLFDRRHGFLGDESEWFHMRFLLREVLEIASQTFQLYDCSTLIPRVWLNNFYVVIMLLNCWSTPLLQEALAHSSALERVTCLTVDMVLDSACAMIVPLIIFVPYLAAFDREMMSFRREDLYNAPWFINMIRENRMLYAMSNVDLVSKLIPHLSIWGCTRTIKASIRRKPRAQITSTEGEACDASSSTTRQSTLATFFHWWRHRKHERHQTRLEKFVHVFFIGWGLAILGAHLQAAHVATSQRDHACIQELRPWLTNTFACATYQFNCATTGVQTVTSADLEVLHATSLAGLIITNCPALEMPDTIQSFSQMIGIVIYNSSVAAWPASAAVTAATHDELVCIIAVRTNFSAIPEGMLQSLPHTIQDIQIAVSNLTRLPDGVHEHWVALSTIVLEYCAFTDFPIELLQIHLDRLSLIGSPIRELPDVFSTAMFGFVGFGISYNPWLSTLPASGFFPQLQGIIIEATNVSELPAWAWASNSSTRIFAINTPFCAAHGNLTGKIECVQRDFEGQGFYPLAVADALYA